MNSIFFVVQSVLISCSCSPFNVALGLIAASLVRSCLLEECPVYADVTMVLNILHLMMVFTPILYPFIGHYLSADEITHRLCKLFLDMASSIRRNQEDPICGYGKFKVVIVISMITACSC